MREPNPLFRGRLHQCIVIADQRTVDVDFELLAGTAELPAVYHAAAEAKAQTPMLVQISGLKGPGIAFEVLR